MKVSSENDVKNIVVLLIEDLTSAGLIKAARHLEFIKTHVLHDSITYMNVNSGFKKESFTGCNKTQVYSYDLTNSNELEILVSQMTKDIAVPNTLVNVILINVGQ